STACLGPHLELRRGTPYSLREPPRPTTPPRPGPERAAREREPLVQLGPGLGARRSGDTVEDSLHVEGPVLTPTVRTEEDRRASPTPLLGLPSRWRNDSTAHRLPAPRVVRRMRRAEGPPRAARQRVCDRESSLVRTSSVV